MTKEDLVQLRSQALHLATKEAIPREPSETTIARAEAYFKFLKGNN